jgi:hypothetical protein
MLDQLFKVATEFRFDIGHAMVGSQALQGQVDKLSNSVDNALLSFQRLGVGVVANLGLGGGGLLGILQQSVSSWENFRNAQLTFVNSISANKDKLTGPIDTFNERLLVSQEILKDVAKVSREFGLPQKELVNMTKLLAPMLIPEGLAGNNFKGAIDLSRKFLKAAPSFGVSPEESTFQLQSAIGGRASLQQTLFQRLTVETQAMREFAGQTERFNKLAPDKRFKLINEALDQFSSDAGVLSGRVELISVQLQRIKEIFVGVGGVLLPIGEIVNKLGSNFLKNLESTVNTQGRLIINNIVAFFKPMTTSLENLIVMALQLREISRDLKKSGTTLGVLGIVSIIGGLTTIFKLFKWLSVPIMFILSPIVNLIGKLGILNIVWRALLFVITKLTIPLMLIFGFFQLLSRASAIAKVNDLKAMPEIVSRFTSIMLRLKTAFSAIIYPFAQAFDWLANKISFVFSKTILLRFALEIFDSLVSVFEAFARGVVYFYAVFAGISTAIIALVTSIATLDFSNLGTKLTESFSFGYDETLKKFTDKFATGEAPVISNVQNFHGGIKIENKFKENQEPDRIAFTMIEQLSKAGRNKTQAAGMSLKPSNSYVGA